MAKDGMPKEVRTVMYWALGIGIIALTIFILTIIFGNLSGNTGFDRLTATTTNETGAWLNTTAYTVDAVTSRHGFVSISVSEVWNTTVGVIPVANYTISATAGTMVNASLITYPDVNVTYAVTYKGQAERGTDAVIGNYTDSAVNTAKQFPTTGTILGIALLLAILIGILVFAIRKMMGVAGAGSVGSGGRSSGSSSAKFDRAGFR